MSIRGSNKRPSSEKFDNPPVASASAIDSATTTNKVGRLQPNGFASLLTDLATGRFLGVDAIRNGFPSTLVKDTALYFDVPVARIRSLAGLNETAAHALIRRGANLDPAASERIWRLAHVVAMAQDVFEDDKAAKTWLQSINRAFGDVAPMDYLDTEPGAMAVRQVLNAIATGGAA
ncbi:antitoxin Xre/MbcA/ParS toxin-binding domain-containing protein [Massilia aquatica]|uniref:DUF2384 domain-containing protein n=1 Tax=Massilia aquatica TaxID=2609000 RepID=A0ABX0M9E5_9BURK|nr:antitoxin Xre/MbcA/ParS toxin-binding domain-containing protein [Massilia aquatica]NHZ43796.1 DUF2384 domain-containing protein [Massilia aquatica]